LRILCVDVRNYGTMFNVFTFIIVGECCIYLVRFFLDGSGFLKVTRAYYTLNLIISKEDREIFPMSNMSNCNFIYVCEFIILFTL